MDRPTVSVCMITYNHEEFIQEAIKGVVMQDVSFDIEFVISNDASTDKTHPLITELAIDTERIKINYVNQPKNLGMIENFIFALKTCKGKYIALCEGDDFWTDKFKLQKQVDFLEANADCAICFHKVKILSNGKFTSNDITEQRFSEITNPRPSQKELIVHGNFMHTPSVVFRNLIDEFPSSFNKSTVGDYFLHIMVSANGYIKRLEETMAVYRAGVGVFSSQKKLAMNSHTLVYQACILSYLEDSNLRILMLDKQLNVIANHARIVKANQVNSKLATEKSFPDLFKMFLYKLKYLFKA